MCCELHLDVVAAENAPRVPTGQLWCLFLGQIAFMVWMLFLMHSQLRAAQAADSRTVSASDYTVIIKGIPRRRADDALLRRWLAQWGEVVTAFSLPSVGAALHVGDGVERLELRAAEAAALELEDARPSSLRSFFGAPARLAYRKLVVGRRSPLLKKLEAERHRLQVYERQEARPTGQGLGVFAYAEAAAACVADHDVPPARRALDGVCFGWTSEVPRLHGVVVGVSR
jgi:hypothetical protein